MRVLHVHWQEAACYKTQYKKLFQLNKNLTSKYRAKIRRLIWNFSWGPHWGSPKQQIARFPSLDLRCSWNNIPFMGAVILNILNPLVDDSFPVCSSASPTTASLDWFSLIVRPVAAKVVLFLLFSLGTVLAQWWHNSIVWFWSSSCSVFCCKFQ